jgi:uncharacterized protein (UPF0332 family)
MKPQGEHAKVIRYWWDMAQESLTSAQRELEAGVFAFAANRLYYAAFYGVSAALLERGLQFRRHSAVRAAYHREFIKTGVMDVKWGKFYDQLFEDRQEGDYVALTSFDREYIEAQWMQCAELLQALRSLICSLSQG